MQDKIHIACSTDDNYTQHCVAMLSSLFTNNPTQSLLIHVIKNGLSQKNEEIITKFIRKHNVEYKFCAVDPGGLTGNAPVHGYVSISSYYRFFLPSIVDETVDKILYLDSDIIVRTDISPLWNTDVDGYYAAAVQEPISDEHLRQIGLKTGSAYFNAGILVVNLKKWREDNITEKCVTFTLQYPERVIYWDQDVLNNVFNDNWKRLNPYWNVSHFYYRNGCDAAYFGLSEQVYNDLKFSPGIVHFTGPHKPWLYTTQHPFKQEYRWYLKGTQWASFREVGRPGLIQRGITGTKKVIKSLLGKSNTDALIALIRK